VFVWAIVVSAGMFWMVRYQMTPGAQGAEVPGSWPSGVSFAPNDRGWTLVMMVHPQCPCSRASVHELSQLMSRSSGHMKADVLFVQPRGAPPNWCDGDLWSDANQIPGVNVAIDRDARDSAIFGAATSGEVLLYDAAGKLQFSGGITDGRGHEGENAGYLAILSLIRGGRSRTTATPVYGCSLGVSRQKSASD
jgi:hypothetical protein